MPNAQRSDGFPPDNVYKQQNTFVPSPLLIIPRPVYPLFIFLVVIPPSTSMPEQSSLQVPTPPAAISRGNSDSSIHKVQNLPGYVTPVFKGKDEQRAKVQADVASKVCNILSQPALAHPILINTHSTLGFHPKRTRPKRSPLVLLPAGYRRYLFQQ
jgi:hypothetical protein